MQYRRKIALCVQAMEDAATNKPRRKQKYFFLPFQSTLMLPVVFVQSDQNFGYCQDEPIYLEQSVIN